MAAAVLMPAAVAARALLPTIAMTRPIRVHDRMNWPTTTVAKKYSASTGMPAMRPLNTCRPSPPG